MKKLKLYLFIFVLLGISINVSAYDSIRTYISSNFIEVKSGETIEFLFSFKTDDDINKEITAFKATLDYDENIFEEVSKDNFELSDSWEEFLYNPNNKQFVLINKSGILKEENVLKVRLKAKNNIPNGKTIVSIKDIISSNGDKDINLNDAKIQIKTVSESITDGGSTSNPGNDETTDDKPQGGTNSGVESGSGSTDGGSTSNPGNDETTDDKPQGGTNSGVESGSGSTDGGSTSNPGNDETTDDKSQANVNLAIESGNSNLNGENTNTSLRNESSNNLQENINDKSDEYINNDITDNNTTNNNTEVEKVNKEVSYGRKIIILAISIIVLILLILFIKKKLENEQGKLTIKAKIILIVVIVIAVLSQIFIVAKAISRKGELDGNGEINYKDVSILEQHLIDLNKLSNNLLEYADMNSDGNITVTDLALLVQKIEDRLEYNVDINSIIENYYPNKNEDFELRFTANVSYGEELEEVTINDQVYKVDKDSNTGEYVVKFNTGDNAGIKEFNFTKVKLSTGKEVNVNFTEKIDVLKEQPTIQNYEVTEILTDAKMQISFDLIDLDSSLTGASAEVIEKNTSNVIKTIDIVKGNNTFTIDNLDENKEYELNICITYDLDSNTLTNHDQDNSGSITYSYDLKLNIDYNFKFSDIKTLNNEGNETTEFDKNEPITVRFTSENSTIYKPKTVEVNGITYELTEEGNQYTFTLPGIEDSGENQIKLDNIVLDNGKVFMLNENNTVNVQIKEEAPTVSEDSIEVSDSVEEADDKILFNVSFKIDDSDNTIRQRQIIIRDAYGRAVFSEYFDELNFSKSYELPNVSPSYTVEVKVYYDNGSEQVEETIYEKNIDITPKVDVVESKVSTTKLEKNQNVVINYKFSSNQIEEIKQIVVNNTTLIAEKKSDDSYEVTIPVGNEAGETYLTLSKIIFNNNLEVEVSKIDKVEILKDIPEVTDYAFSDSLGSTINARFSFTIHDEDNAFIAGTAQLIKDNTVISEKQIEHSGENTVEFEVDEMEEYKFKITLQYARDIDKTMGETMFFDKPVMVVREYNLQISDIQTLKSDSNVTTKYFNKDENIKVSFTSRNDSPFDPSKAVINGREYDLTKIGDNKYESTIDGFNTSGVKDIDIEKIYLTNNKELDIENTQCKVEVLKVAPSVESFSYEEIENNKIRLKFNINDSERTFESGKLIVTDESNTDVCTVDNLEANKDLSYEFNLNSSEKYNVKVLLTYDLDTDALGAGENEYQNQEVLNQEITITQELVELKDIESVKLYRKSSQLYRSSDDSIEQVRDIDVQSFNPDDYIAEISMKNMPTLYATVKSGKVVGNEFILGLNYGNSVSYEEDGNSYDKKNEVEVIFGYVNDDIASNIDFDELIKRVQENPTATINLTSDLDASTISLSSATYLGDFKGTINGNGHTIKNMTKPLFNSLESATIKNLVIENSKMVGDPYRAILSITATSSTIENVHINNSRLEAWNANGTGAFIGSADNGTKIKDSSANNVYVQSKKVVGGIVGYLKNGSSIDNSYIKGKVKAWEDAVGGVIGQTSGTVTLQNSYAYVEFDMQYTWGIGGLVGTSTNNGIILKNNISLATGNHGSKIIGSTTNYDSSSDNNYELQESTLGSNANGDKVKVISKNDINEDFFKENLGWDEEVWNLTGATGENMPNLKRNPINNGSNSSATISSFDRISRLEGYDKNREIAYYNMQILIPFYDAKLYVDYGNLIDENDTLNKSKIVSVIPYNEENKMINGLDTDTYNTIKKIKIIFEDNTIKEYNISFNKIFNSIAVYEIDDLGIKYTYNRFVLDINNPLIDEIVERANNLDYRNNIATLTSEDESRLYVDYYNEYVKPRLRDVIINILQSEDDYNLYLNNEVLNDKIKNELFTNNQLEKLLYTYNYYDKWYNFNIGGIRASDLLFFSSDVLLNKNYGLKEITEKTLNTSSDNRSTGNAIGFYNNIVKLQTNKDIKSFFDYYTKIEGFESPADWFTDSFKGILVEKSIDNQNVQYRAWDLLLRRQTHILSILSAPQEDMYIFASPMQFIIGSLNLYDEWATRKDRAAMMNKIESFAEKTQNFFNISSSFIANSENLLNNNAVQVTYDSRTGFIASTGSNGEHISAGKQEAGTTEDPVIKWVYEALGKWNNIPNASAGAYATGSEVYCVGKKILHEYSTWTHETAHNHDANYFFGGRVRRSTMQPEYFANGFIMQSFLDGSFLFNLTYDYNYDNEVTVNFKSDRLKGEENINDYYHDLFDTLYVLDYLTAQAYLKLTPQEKAILGVVTSTNGRNTTYYNTSSNYFEDVDSMEKLYDKKINLRTIGDRRAGTVSEEISEGYKDEFLYNIYWYTPFNPNGASDPMTVKIFSYEMLGYAGYNKGFTIYPSNASKNDIDALQKITGFSDYKQYKLSRWKTVEDNLNNLAYFNAEEVIDMFYNALKADIKLDSRPGSERPIINSVRRMLLGNIRRMTDDFTNGNVYTKGTVIEISSAQELINAIAANPQGSYKLTTDIDFSNITGSTAYIQTKFMGSLDGDGHRITGLDKPLFSNIFYGRVYNLTIDGSLYTVNHPAIIAQNAKYASIEKVKVETQYSSIPFIANIDTYSYISEDSGNGGGNVIKTVNDLLNIVNSEETLSYSYVLDADLDLTGIDIANKSSYIEGIFKGNFDGNGHTISGLNIPLFNDIGKNGIVKNIKVSNAKIENKEVSNVGTISKTLSGTINNIKITDATIKGNQYVGGLTGRINGGTVDKIGVIGVNITSENTDKSYVGGLSGYAQSNSNLTNIFVSGEITVPGAKNGGILGGISASSLKQFYAAADLKRPEGFAENTSQENGTVIGSYEGTSAPTVLKGIAVGNVASDMYRGIGGHHGTVGNIDNYTNNTWFYVKPGITGITLTGVVGSVELARYYYKKSFYTDTLNFSTEIWECWDVLEGESGNVVMKFD